MISSISNSLAGLSLLRRVFLATSVALLIASILMLQASTQQDVKKATEGLERQLLDDLSTLPGIMVEPIVVGDYSTLNQILDRYVQRENLSAIHFRTDSGKEIKSKNLSNNKAAPDWFSALVGISDLSSEAPVALGGRVYGTLKVTLSSQKWVNQAWARFKSNLIGMGIALLFALFGIWLVIKTGLSSLKALEEGASKLASGEFDVRLEPTGSPELRQSMESFNVMADAITSAQNRLKLEAERLQVTLSSIADGVISTDAHGRVVFMNNAAEKMTGWTEFEAKRRRVSHIFKLINESNLEEITSPIDLILAGSRTEGHAEGFALLVSRDGRKLPISDSASSIRHADGRLEGAVLVFRDQTVARAKEAQLKELNVNLERRVQTRTQDLESANKQLQSTIQSLHVAQNQLIQSEKMAALGGLVAGISHEINTPIGIGVTSASTIHEEVKTLQKEFESGSMKRSSLENFINHASLASDILLKNLHRAADLIRSFKQIAVDQSSDDTRAINLQEYIDEILASLHPKFSRKAITVSNQCDMDLSIYTQPGAIYQIISNLILNSLTHGYETGDVGNIIISARQEVDDIVLEYHDDGKGIDEQHIKKVFDPFFTTKRGQGGSGLGLNIVYNLVNNTLNGKIEVWSRVGQGAHFKIVFPARHNGGMA